ncbi:MAG: acetolactate decarboxylase [Solirubrobacterales bacterium]|nr:acetolactate decarboxylase [Solirubrobacterales bacterium]
MIEESMIRALHVESMRSEDLHAGHESHTLFQASTVSALLDGSYDGDLSFAELAEQGDTGLGTLNGLDGEMIALDGQFLRADFRGTISVVSPDSQTPFAVVGWFEPDLEFEISGVVGFDHLVTLLEERMPPGTPAAAVRIDGDFKSVTARSVPRQHAPYRPLAEVVADQNVFELPAGLGTLVGFRFPSYSERIEIAGYHLHFVDHGRKHGGHVLDLEIEAANVKVEVSSDLHIELPPGMDLGSPDLAGDTHAAIERAERLK